MTKTCSEEILSSVSTLVASEADHETRITALEGAGSGGSKEGHISVSGNNYGNNSGTNGNLFFRNQGTARTVTIEYDEGSLLSTGGSNTVDDTFLTVPASGILIISIGCSWTSNANGYRELSIRRHTGAGTSASISNLYDPKLRINPISGITVMCLTQAFRIGAGDFRLNVGDNIMGYCYQNSGSNFVYRENEFTFFHYEWITS
jgi:hypothetical protein